MHLLCDGVAYSLSSHQPGIYLFSTKLLRSSLQCISYLWSTTTL